MKSDSCPNTSFKRSAGSPPNRFALSLLLLFLWQGSPLVAQNILFYGNSFTLGAGSSDSVPNLVHDIAVAAGQATPFTHNAAVSGQSFTWHLANNLDPISNTLPVGQEWDYAVLQNFSTAPTHLGNVSQHRADAVSLYQEIANHSPNFTPVLFETWARGPGHSFYTGATPNFPGGPAEMQAEVRNGYLLAAQDIDITAGAGTVRLAEVGDRWEDANWNNLHAGDIYHANNRGTLLTSLVIYSTIYQDDTSDIDLSNILSGLGLTPDEGVFLSSIADEIEPPSPPTDVTLKFDFGASSHPDPNYNVVSANAQSLANAIDFSTGLSTNIGLSITSATGFNEAGSNTSGTTSPGAPASDFFDGNATANNLFGHDGNFNVGSPRDLVEYTISGLVRDQLYDFTFYASRTGVSDNRETQYDLAGLNMGTDFLDPSENISDIAQVLAILPDVNGEITLTIQKGPNNVNTNGFFYLGAMEIQSSIVVTADFDSDIDVDGTDFLSWQRGLGINGSATLSQGDGNADGAVDASDLAIWKSQFGNTTSLSAATNTVPEPGAALLLVVGLLACFLSRSSNIYRGAVQ